MRKTMLIVCGNFDYAGGRRSGLFDKIYNEISLRKDVEVSVYNGGFLDELRNRILSQVKDFDIVLWGPNVSNEEEKIRNVKEINPKTILISTKRNNGEYTFAELISRALAQKSNLVLEFSRVKDGNEQPLYEMMVFDPLGNEFFKGTDVKVMANIMVNRAIALTGFTEKCFREYLVQNSKNEVQER